MPANGGDNPDRILNQRTFRRGTRLSSMATYGDITATMKTLPRKDRFNIPDGVVYLDGNSLGPLPIGVELRVQKMLCNEWGDHLISAWNLDDWMTQPQRVGNLIARLIGAADGTVAVGDTLSIQLFQALSAALKMRPGRKVILSDSGNFPGDLYIAQGLIKQLDKEYELRIVPPGQISAAMNDEVAVTMLTQVDYRTGRMHDMNAVSAAARTAGSVMIWDLAHSAGAVPVELHACAAEFAVGCTYKYLNGGPGSPAFIYVRPDLVHTVQAALSGWLGSDKPFAFEPIYSPARGVERLRIGTPAVIQMTALEQAMMVWEGVEMRDIRHASIRLMELFIGEVERQCPQLSLESPRNAEQRGSQVSFSFEHSYAAMQALIARGVIGDFRAPNLMRFGFTPLYLDAGDVHAAVAVISDVMSQRLWDKPEYLKQNRVT